jgi:hypothetical protein
MLHIYHNMLTYIQQNDFAHLAASIERADHTPSTPGFWPALCSLHKDLQTHLVPLFALRSIFVHVLINWFYNIRFLQVETLARGEAPRWCLASWGSGPGMRRMGGYMGIGRGDWCGMRCCVCCCFRLCLLRCFMWRMGWRMGDIVLLEGV